MMDMDYFICHNTLQFLPFYHKQDFTHLHRSMMLCVHAYMHVCVHVCASECVCVCMCGCGVFIAQASVNGYQG